uniref:Dihydroprymidine dehydrogenase domain-containing protein n=1 Tax=candidate division WOR-3 bacterium TaxID=2052148 RepID=A0A7C2K0W6_UNCW3
MQWKIIEKRTLLPCKYNCPLEIDIPLFVRFIKKGDYDKALRVIKEKTPLVEVLGHICTHPCEDACRRNHLSESVYVRELKNLSLKGLFIPLRLGKPRKKGWL